MADTTTDSGSGGWWSYVEQANQIATQWWYQLHPAVVPPGSVGGTITSGPGTLSGQVSIGLVLALAAVAIVAFLLLRR